MVHRAWVVHRAVHRAMAGRGLAWVQLTWLEQQLSKVHAAFRKCTLTNLTEAATVQAVDDFKVKLGLHDTITERPHGFDGKRSAVADS